MYIKILKTSGDQFFNSLLPKSNPLDTM